MQDNRITQLLCCIIVYQLSCSFSHFYLQVFSHFSDSLCVECFVRVVVIWGFKVCAISQSSQLVSCFSPALLGDELFSYLTIIYHFLCIAKIKLQKRRKGVGVLLLLCEAWLWLARLHALPLWIWTRVGRPGGLNAVEWRFFLFFFYDCYDIGYAAAVNVTSMHPP